MSGNLFEDVDDEEDEEVIDVEATEVVEESAAPVPDNIDNSLIQPVADPSEVAAVYETFEELKKELLKKDDLTKISGNFHVNKSGWRKIATAFNVSTELLEKERSQNGYIISYSVRARAIAPNGKFADGVGMCSSNESNFTKRVADDNTPEDKARELASNPTRVIFVDNAWREILSPSNINEHNLYATAYTRAVNRAISDLVGGGEVSAEEITKEQIFGE